MRKALSVVWGVWRDGQDCDLAWFRALIILGGVASLAASTVGLFVLVGEFFLIAQYKKLVLGLSPHVAALVAS